MLVRFFENIFIMYIKSLKCFYFMYNFIFINILRGYYFSNNYFVIDNSKKKN